MWGRQNSLSDIKDCSYLLDKEFSMKPRIVTGPLTDGTPAKAKYRIARSNGTSMKVRIVDADSPTFGADFQAAFAENVRRARRENRAIKSGV